MDDLEPDLDVVDLSNAESSKLLISEVVRSTFDDFADEIMSLYGSQQHEDRLETLSSTSIPELRQEYSKVSAQVSEMFLPTVICRHYCACAGMMY